MERPERSAVRDDIESSAKKVALELYDLVNWKFWLCCQVATSGFVEGFRRVTNDLFQAILYMGKDNADGKLTCVTIHEEWIFYCGDG